MTAKEEQLRGQTVAGNYRILELLGSGGMGSVYKALNVRLDKTVAIKMVHSHLRGDTGKQKQRLLREARVLGALKHPNVVGIETIHADNDNVFIVMEYLEGLDLASYLEQVGPLSTAAFNALFRQVCAGLAYAHNQGVIHRDIKPSNIMLLGDPFAAGYVCNAKLVDFGLAKLLDDSAQQKLTATGSIMGSLNYMSPEQCQSGVLTTASDIYSLACVMHQSLSGKLPYDADTPMATIFKHANEMLPALEDKEMAPLSAVLQRCTAPEPVDRFQRAEEVWEAIENRSVVVVSAPKLGEKKHRGKSDQSNLLLSIMAVVLLVVVAGITIRITPPERATSEPIPSAPPGSAEEIQENLKQQVYGTARQRLTNAQRRELLKQIQKQFARVGDWNFRRELTFLQSLISQDITDGNDRPIRDRQTISMLNQVVREASDDGNKVQAIEDAFQREMSPETLITRRDIVDDQLNYLAKMPPDEAGPTSSHSQALALQKARLLSLKARIVNQLGNHAEAEKLATSVLNTIISMPSSLDRGNKRVALMSGYTTAGLMLEIGRQNPASMPKAKSISRSLLSKLRRELSTADFDGPTSHELGVYAESLAQRIKDAT